MIKDEIQAKLISDLMLDIGRKLDASVADIQNNVSEEEFNHYRHALFKSSLFDLLMCCLILK